MIRTVVMAGVTLAVFAGSVAAQNRSDANFVRPDPGRIPAAIEGSVGNTCPPGASIGALPASIPGNTCGGTNSITNYSGSCTLNFPYGGEDQVFSITLGAANNVQFSADLTGSTGDLALFLIGTCGDGASCVANSQDEIGVGVGPEVIDPASYPAGTYFLYVDSYYNAGSAGSCGSYTLDVTGTVPVELESFQVL